MARDSGDYGKLSEILERFVLDNIRIIVTILLCMFYNRLYGRIDAFTSPLYDVNGADSPQANRGGLARAEIEGAEIVADISRAGTPTDRHAIERPQAARVCV